MSFGQMNAFVEIIRPFVTTDAAGFFHETDEVVANIRAYREGKHGTEKRANRAAFTEATDLFRFRVIPGLCIDTDMILVTDGKRFWITSVENVRGKGMYIEVLAKEVTPSGKSNCEDAG